MLILDATTLAEYLSAGTPALQAQAVIDALDDPVQVRVYDGAGNQKGAGTMQAPWATQAGGLITFGEFSSFAAEVSGTPDANWYLRFESGSRWLRGSFGLQGSGAEGTWSLPTWAAGQAGVLGTATAGVPTNTAPSLVGAPQTLAYSQGVGGSYGFAAHVYDPDGGPFTYALTGTVYSGITINASSGVLTIGATATAAVRNLVLRVTDSGGLSTDWPVQVTISATEELSVAALQALGYLVVTAAPYNADRTGLTNSHPGIQQAIIDGYKWQRPVYIPAGTYLVNDTLCLYTWVKWPQSSTEWAHGVFGNSVNPPTIKLMSSGFTSGFQSAADPKPVICCRTFQAVDASGTHENFPAHPYDLPAGYSDGRGIGFDETLQHIIVDTNQQPGAIGVSWHTAQCSYMHHIRVIATGSLAGFNGVSATQGSHDLEVIGGQYGLFSRQYRTEKYGSGQCIAGLRCFGQTVANIEVDDFTPCTFVGFHFTKATAGPSVVPVAGGSTTRRGTPVLIDGVIEMASGTAIDNPGNTLYARNVYITGTNNLVKSGSLSTVTGSGAWKRIDEYAYANPNGTRVPAGGYPDEYTALPHLTMTGAGAATYTEQPVVSVSNSVTAPGELWRKHVVTIPTIDSGPFVSVMDYGATPYNPSGSTGWSIIPRHLYWNTYAPATKPADSLAAFNAAIAAAEAAGHNRVVVPRGMYANSGPLALRAHTQLFGVGPIYSIVGSTMGWNAATGGPHYMVTTPDSASGTCSLTNVGLVTRSTSGSYTGSDVGSSDVIDRFNHLLWRTGRRSFSLGVNTVREFQASRMTNERAIYTFSGNGGGRHYFIEQDGRGQCHPEYRLVKAVGTTEPLTFYGPSGEAGKGGPSETSGSVYYQQYTQTEPEANIELDNCENVRVYNTKREGSGATIDIHSSRNAALYGNGVSMLATAWKRHLRVSGDPALTNNIVLACCTIQKADYTIPASANQHYFVEDLDGESQRAIFMHEGLCIYKRGTLDDSAMVHT